MSSTFPDSVNDSSFFLSLGKNPPPITVKSDSQERPVARCHRISESFGRKPHFHVIVRLKHNISRKTHSSMPSHFRVFWKEASLSCYCRAKGQYRKKNCSNFETSDQLECKLSLFFFIRLLYSVNS